MRNLALEQEYAHELERHRELLDDWMRESGDRGSIAEPASQLRATYDLWKENGLFKNAATNPEFEPFRRK